MYKHLIAGCGLIAMLFTAEASFGGFMVTLSGSQSGNPVILSAGQSITIDVLISGIDNISGPLELLGVTTVFDAVSLGAPFSSSFGSIVPNPSNGILTVGSGNVTGLYDILIPSGGTDLPISANGTFYQFTLTAQSVATTVDSVISISNAEYSNANGDFTADFGAGINVRVLGDPPVVPEPSSWLIMSVLGIGFAFARKQTTLFI
jgi:hypothetical protein